MSLFDSVIREHLALKRRRENDPVAGTPDLPSEVSPASPVPASGSPAGQGRARRATERTKVASRAHALAHAARGSPRRAIAVVAALVLTTAFVSYTTTMLAPSDSSVGIRSVEWLRDHGFAWLVADVEQVYYSFNAPAKGGRALRVLPRSGLSTPVAHAAARSTYRPPTIRPVIRPALPGEGIWRRAGPQVGGAPPVLVTTLRPESAYPRLVAGVAWIDASRTRLFLYPGRLEPPGLASRGPMKIPRRLRPQLLAAFNSGFKLADSGGGFVVGGQAPAPLHQGAATLITYRDGRVDIARWTGAARPAPEVLAARQNLPPIVEGGAPNPNLGDGAKWGVTVGNAIRVWRSGIGVDPHGNLIYAAANNQTVRSLADILIRAGAVRAMELDINSYWVSFITYAGWNAAHPTKLLPDMQRTSSRYLSVSDRDFFVVYRRG